MPNHYNEPLKFNLPASIYYKLYDAKINDKHVEMVLHYEHIYVNNGFDLIYLDKRMIYTLYKFNLLKIILVPNELRDLKYRVAFENDSLYVIGHPRYITNDIDDIRHRINLRDTTIYKNITGEEMNLISFFYQRIGDELEKVKKHPRESKV